MKGNPLVEVLDESKAENDLCHKDHYCCWPDLCNHHLHTYSNHRPICRGR